MFTSKTGKGKPLHSQTREIIAGVMHFMKQEAEEGTTIPIANYRERVRAATGISKNAYHSIAKEQGKVKFGEKSSFSSFYTDKNKTCTESH
ncbi:hypothetical protein Zmor_010784 [Zophobas morio]|uniref:Uncharacterized protein n=1 Tax=Zophobas morio TaxID=2755281 RepID=A0AA38MJY3_9CUCU|nr:hypothetical protein Zmor_010784 [Zophobas morio]